MSGTIDGTRARRLFTAASGGLLVFGILGGGLVGAAPATAATTATAMATATFQPIREFFDDNRVARHRDAAAACAHDNSTLQIVTCAEDRTENVDVTIDAVRAKEFAEASTAAEDTAIDQDDATWLANRIPVCAGGYQGDLGTIVQILAAQCETDVSRARLDGVQDKPVPTARLTATDNTDPTATQYATTAGGARVGAIDTQGDETGGVVIGWVVIAGYRGFTVEPSAFTYVDGAFVDAGVVQGHPRGHYVKPGTEYFFDIDYSTIAKDPDESKGTGRFEYRTGGHVVGAWT